MKIQMTHDRLARGGQERQIIELLKSFKLRPEIEVEVVFFSDEISYPEIFDLGYPVHFLKRKYKLDPAALWRYYKLCKKFKPDIIHSWGQLSPIYAFPPITFIKTVFINQNIMNARRGMSILNKQFLTAKLTFTYSDIVIGNSWAGIEVYKPPKSKSMCIHNGFDFNRSTTLSKPEEMRKQLNIQPGPIVGMVAAFHDRKDYDTFIQMAIILLDAGVTANFLAIGEGDNFDRCKAMVPEKHKDRILLPGQMSNVESIVNIFNIGVLSTNSDVHGEGISNSIIEYMVFGKPVIATNGGGTPEIVKENENGFLVPPKSPTALAEKTRYLLDRPELATKMGKAGESLVKEHFSIQRMERQYLELYAKCLGSQPLAGSMP